MVNAQIGSPSKLKAYDLMADGGSGVNTIPEKTLVEIRNDQTVAGMKLNDNHQPVVQLEDWDGNEALSGIAVDA